MYINDISIMYYALFIIMGMVAGQLVDWANIRLPEYKKVFSKEIFSQYKKKFKPNYLLMLITSVFYLGLLWKFGIGETFVENIDLIKYVVLVPMLLSVTVIDYRLQIIPNKLNFRMFQFGLILAFIIGITNVSQIFDLGYGMLAGAGIFLSITLLGALFYGKEAMGMGDVKFMGALGLIFGLKQTLIITVLSFLIGAMLSILLIASKKKKSDEYIPFGPFIVIAVFIAMYVPVSTLQNALFEIFTLGMY